MASWRGPDELSVRVRGSTARRRRPRAFLAGIAALLAACGAGAPVAAPPSQVLNLYSWAEYFPSEVLRQFEAETGIRVNYAVFDSNDVAETTLSAGNSGFDLVTVNASPHLGRQIPKGLWQPLDRARLRNLPNVDATILAMLAHVDPGNRYAIPYMWGTVGLIFNAARVRALVPDAPLDSLDMVFKPQLASRLERCGITVLGSWVDMLPILSGYLGQRDLPTDAASLAAVSVAFGRVRPYIRRVTTAGYYEQLARGELCLAIGYSADAMVARRRAAEYGTGVTVDYRPPREVVPVYIDAYAIPASARHVAAAHRFIDFTLRADIGARLARATGFALANTAAVAALEPELRDNPIVYPGADVRARFQLGRGYTMDETRMLARTWLRMKTGR